MEVDEENRSKQPAFHCKDDAAEQNDMYRSQTVSTQVHAMDELAEMAGETYVCKKVWQNYRATKVVVKVELAEYPVSVKAAVDLALWAAEHGFTKGYRQRNHSVVFEQKRETID